MTIACKLRFNFKWKNKRLIWSKELLPRWTLKSLLGFISQKNFGVCTAKTGCRFQFVCFLCLVSFFLLFFSLPPVLQLTKRTFDHSLQRPKQREKKKKNKEAKSRLYLSFHGNSLPCDHPFLFPKVHSASKRQRLSSSPPLPPWIQFFESPYTKIAEEE